jgi:SAM-dependent methyltransferase
MQTERIRFETRQDRPRFISKRFSSALSGRVLDVGCDRAVLREFVGVERYIGIDLSDDADIRQNLMLDGHLPFDDAEWDAVVCLDVLEHLEKLHEVLGELVRVARRHVVVSLPNNWCGARGRLSRGHGAIGKYGLPLDAPVDRHRWFFSLLQARKFFIGQAERHGLEIEELVALEAPRTALVRGLRHVRYLKENHYLNLYAHTLVCVYRKLESPH